MYNGLLFKLGTSSEDRGLIINLQLADLSPEHLSPIVILVTDLHPSFTCKTREDNYHREKMSSSYEKSLKKEILFFGGKVMFSSRNYDKLKKLNIGHSQINGNTYKDTTSSRYSYLLDVHCSRITIYHDNDDDNSGNSNSCLGRSSFLPGDRRKY